MLDSPLSFSVAVPALPIVFAFFKDNPIEPDNYSSNFVRLMNVAQPLDPVLVKQSVRSVIEHHESLRFRFIHKDGQWKQFIAAPGGAVPFAVLDLSLLSSAEQGPAIEQAIARFRCSLNLATGPLLRVVLFELGGGQQRLLIIVHHLAMDGFSTAILLEDLYSAYKQISQGKIAVLPLKTTPVKQWAELLADYAHSDRIERDLHYWRTRPWSDIAPLPMDFPEQKGNDTDATTQILTASLSAEETQMLLCTAGNAQHSESFDVLLAALAKTVAEWTGRRSVLVEVVHHGREPIFDGVDLSRTLGWLTIHFPLVLNLGTNSTLPALLPIISEQYQAIPNSGLGYGLLRYLRNDPDIVESFQSFPSAQIRLNYTGLQDQALAKDSIFTSAKESVRAGLNVNNIRYMLLEVNAAIDHDRLVVNWSYSERLYLRTTIEQLSASFFDAIRSFIRD